MNTIFYLLIQSLVYIICLSSHTLVFISILCLTIDNYYCHNEPYMLFMYHFKIILYIIILILVQSKTLGGPIEETDCFVIFF